MSRTLPASIVTALRCCAVVVALAVAAPAHAGLGDLMKKAKDKAAQAVGKKPEAQASAPAYVAPVFDNMTVELNSQRVERILATFKAAGAAGAGRPALVEKLNKVSEERQALEDKHGDAMREQRGKRDDMEGCYKNGYDQARSRAMESYANRALTDPALREKFMKAAQQHNAAAAEGDSAAIKRLQDVMHEEVMPTREDSANVRKECGPMPGRHPSEDKADALDKDIAAANEQIRKIDENVAKAQASAGGMTQEQWFTAIERIQMYMAHRGSSKNSGKASSRSGKGSGSGSGSASGSGSGGSGGSGSDTTSASHPDVPMVSGYTKVEVVALEKNLEPLKAALGY